MPLDSTYTDDLADIDRTKPLTVKNVKRIVRATHAAGLLAMDHHLELKRGFDPDTCIYLSPHGAVDAFLGSQNRDSCPCCFRGRARSHLYELNNLHRIILLLRAVAPNDSNLAREEALFDSLLAD
jgi:hypothetical protein